jgi:glucose/arabinose dehydrogenase
MKPSCMWIPWVAATALMVGCGGGGGGSGRSAAPPAGLTERPANPSCVADSGAGTGSVSTQRAFPRLELGDTITGLYQAPNDSSRWYATLKSGSLVWFENTAGVTAVTPIAGEPTVNVQSEGGLLSMAFHPAFGTGSNRRVYLSYTATAGTGMVSRITRYDLGTDNRLSNPLLILEQAQPAANHNGGNIGFGPDGYLYIGFGDGGGSGDTYENGQNPQTFLSKILRIDVDGGTPYRVPTSNPYHGSSTHLPEIYAQGFRNPWRWSFDRDNGQLIVADVGQNRWEEVNLVEPGRNYG